MNKFNFILHARLEKGSIQVYVWKNYGKEMNRVKVFHSELQVPLMCDIVKLLTIKIFILLYKLVLWKLMNRSVSII